MSVENHAENIPVRQSQLKASSDLTGETFTRLRVVAETDRGERKRRARYWSCECVCGTAKTVRGDHLVSGRQVSCGCFRQEKRIKHGMEATVEYRAWFHMKQRCLVKTHPGFDDYGGRGITVCQEWIDSFQAFFACMGLRPSRKHSLEREDNSKGYEPGNVVWGTRRAQSRNKRNNHRLTFRGETLCITDWAKRVGIHYVCLINRLNRGWTVEKSLTTPVKKKSPRKKTG